jgi:hypothetical protein
MSRLFRLTIPGDFPDLAMTQSNFGVSGHGEPCLCRVFRAQPAVPLGSKPAIEENFLAIAMSGWRAKSLGKTTPDLLSTPFQGVPGNHAANRLTGLFRSARRPIITGATRPKNFFKVFPRKFRKEGWVAHQADK